ncbi:MAG: thiamine-monophosphate kinase, partial [Rickettsiales bacterium]|nr:thiamine-monophosphate kinase [Rickettsiales bacterium]
INEDIHFFASDSAKSIAYRLIIVNLSDVFAKGLKPLFITLNLSFKSGLGKNWYDEFFEEISLLKDRFNFKIIGGDTCLSIKNSLSATVIAESYPNFPKRSRSVLGDDLYVTNLVGCSFLGYNSIKNSRESKFVHNYHYPKPTFDFIPIIKKCANGSTDTSDGLFTSLENISIASNLGFEIDFETIPFASQENPVDQFCISDDYQVLFSSNPDNFTIISDFSKKVRKKITKIGYLTSSSNIIKNISEVDRGRIRKLFHKF